MAGNDSTLQKLMIDDIERGAQTRAKLDESAIADYAEMLKAGQQLAPAIVYRDQDGRLWLSCGYHRMEAHRKAGEPRIPCIVRRGSRWDAIRAGIHDNLQHRGVRLSRADKRHAVALVLAEQPGLSDRAISEMCGVSPSTVGTVRSTVQIGQSFQRAGKDGRVYKIAKAVSETHQEAPPRQLPPMADRCDCGSDWTSDGDGGRFCIECGADHPANPPRPLESEHCDNRPLDCNPTPIAIQPGASGGDPTKFVGDFYFAVGRAKRAIDELYAAGGSSRYRQALAGLDAAEDAVSSWSRESRFASRA